MNSFGDEYRITNNYKQGDRVRANPNSFFDHKFTERDLEANRYIGTVLRQSLNASGTRGYVVHWDFEPLESGWIYWDCDLLPLHLQHNREAISFLKKD